MEALLTTTSETTARLYTERWETWVEYCAENGVDPEAVEEYSTWVNFLQSRIDAGEDASKYVTAVRHVYRAHEYENVSDFYATVKSMLDAGELTQPDVVEVPKVVEAAAKKAAKHTVDDDGIGPFGNEHVGTRAQLPAGPRWDKLQKVAPADAEIGCVYKMANGSLWFRRAGSWCGLDEDGSFKGTVLTDTYISKLRVLGKVEYYEDELTRVVVTTLGELLNAALPDDAPTGGRLDKNPRMERVLLELLARQGGWGSYADFLEEIALGDGAQVLTDPKKVGTLLMDAWVEAFTEDEEE
jgi:hypothetical protein